jgi:hypothetical protein
MLKENLVCGSETWALTEMDLKRQRTWEGKMLEGYTDRDRATNIEKKQ